MDPLAAASLCLGAALLAGGWDLGRRWILRDELRPDPAEVEKFEVEKLHELEGRMQVVELGMSAVADQSLHELELSRSERRSTQAQIAGAKGGRAPRKNGEEPPPEPEVELTDEQILDQVRARYEPS